ncbi:MAG: type II toxin-antitoxin system RelE/ParE family toxin [Bacillota bacterium]|nr:type II toxin-antitoxin system RelE/ParE family toxin [Bacillota bacterium]
MYEQCRDLRLRTMGYRRIVIKNYVMVYKVDDEDKTIYVLRFFYGARDYEVLL